MIQRAVRTTVVVALVLALNAASALADGDPASDVLAQQSLFLPQDASVASTRQAQLTALLTAASRDGFPIRVALIASPSDLGSVSELWNRPQSYARFLGLELKLVYHGPLLVIMPNGLGFSDVGHPGSSGSPAGPDHRSAQLGSRALAAIQQLAAAAGHPLSIPNARPAAQRGSTDIIAWVVLVMGAILIALAWTISLRKRPPRLRRPPQPRRS